MRTSKDKFDEDQTYPVTANFSDASGIRWKTRVQINGIDVGKISKIEHVRDAKGRPTAQVTMQILDDYKLYANAKVRKASESLLGDYRLDVDPGGPQDMCDEYGECPREGFACQRGLCIRSCSQTMECPAPMECVDAVCTYPLLGQEGQAQIGDVQSVSDLDEIQHQLKIVARNVAKVSESVANVFGGPDGEGSLRNILNSVEDSTQVLAETLKRNDERVDQIILNIRAVSDDIRRQLHAGGDIKRSTENIASITEKLDEVAGSIRDMMESANGEDASVRSTLEELNKSMKHIAEITRKIDEGEGAVGALVNERKIVDDVQETVSDINELVGGIARLQTEIYWRSQYEIPLQGDNDEIQSAVKNILGIRIRPKPDKYYLIEVVSDPRGRSTRTIETVSVDDGTPVKTETTTINFEDLKFSAQFAKRFFFLTLRFGIIENSGGVGADLNFFNDDLELRLDAFDFTRRNPNDQTKIFPRFRAALSYEFFDHIAIQAGIDDPLNDRLRTVFVGGVLTFTDEDLKTILPFAPRF